MGFIGLERFIILPPQGPDRSRELKRLEKKMADAITVYDQRDEEDDYLDEPGYESGADAVEAGWNETDEEVDRLYKRLDRVEIGTLVAGVCLGTMASHLLDPDLIGMFRLNVQEYVLTTGSLAYLTLSGILVHRQTSRELESRNS